MSSKYLVTGDQVKCEHTVTLLGAHGTDTAMRHENFSSEKHSLITVVWSTDSDPSWTECTNHLFSNCTYADACLRHSVK